MAITLILPKLDEAMTTAKIVKWLKKEGDSVQKGDGIFEVETEKVTFEVEAESDGVLSKVMAKAGDEVPVGATVAFILQPGEKAPEVSEPAAPFNAATRKETEAKAPEITRVAEAAEVKISPLARRIAEEHSIDLSRVKGSGPGGRIVKEDILRAVEESRVAAGGPKTEIEAAPKIKETPSAEVIPLSAMRKTIAQRMSQSFQTAPHFWVTDEVDATELIKLRQQLIPMIEKETGIKLTYTDILVKVVAKALSEQKNINACWTDNGIKIMPEINVGIATEVPRGLIVPVIHHADTKSLTEIATARADLVARGREGKLNINEITGSTFTLNNVGAVGIKSIDAIINPPESAILTVGRTEERPVVVKGEIVVRPMVDLSLACDHRTLDGASAGRFLLRIKGLIMNPSLMLT